MKNLEQAIRDAVEKGGYSVYSRNVVEGSLPLEEAVKALLRSTRTEAILLDPAFWQALGKARGWKPLGFCDVEYYLSDCAPCVKNAAEWQYNWHRLIDHLASGKDVESFFETL